jgi:hypothetical protein
MTSLSRPAASIASARTLVERTIRTSGSCSRQRRGQAVGAGVGLEHDLATMGRELVTAELFELVGDQDLHTLLVPLGRGGSLQERGR